MNIYGIDQQNSGKVAEFMASIKPDWWDFEGANRQLQDVSLLAKLVGWYMEEKHHRLHRHVLPWQTDHGLCGGVEKPQVKREGAF